MGMKSKMCTLTDKYIAFMLFVFPLWLSPGGYTDITRWKFAFFAAATSIWAVLLVFFAVKERMPPRLPRCFTVTVLLFLVWAALSSALSGYGARTLLGYHYDGLISLALYAVILLGCAGYGEFHKYYVYLLGASAALCCLLALVQLMGYNPIGLYPEGMDYYDSGVSYTGAFLGTLGNTNILGAFLCISCLLTGFAALHYGGRDLFLLLPSALCALVAVLSKSEAALLGIAAGALIGIPYYVHLHSSRRPALIFLGCEAALLIAGLALVYFAAPASGTLYELHEILHGRISDSFGSSRIAIWREALRLFAEEPLTGGGPGTFGLRSTLEFSRYVAETGMTLTTRADNAHCMLLGYLADLGIPGALAYAALCIVILRRAAKSGFPALFPALAGYLVQSLFGLGTCFILPIVCIFSGLSVTDIRDLHV